MERVISELDAIGLAAAKKFDGSLVDERHVPQIQNQLLPRCLADEHLFELLDILRCFDPATECEQGLTVPCSPSSQHASSLCVKMPDARSIPCATKSTRDTLKQLDTKLAETSFGVFLSDTINMERHKSWHLV
jgi:hypothetical protein